jgi:glycosyltransferase involved in cell wall biosynthesis
MIRAIVLIPCYNEEKNISNVVRGICGFAEHHAVTSFTIDYIIINDCSKDRTLTVCKENGYNYINLPINLGIGGCVQTGYRYAYEHGYDIAIQHDGDGQHDPACFEDVIAPIASGQADIVIGSRFMDNRGFQSTGLRRLGIGFLSGIIRFCAGVKIHDVTSGYRAVNRRCMELFTNHYAQDYPEPESIVDAARVKAKIIEVPVIMHERKEGKSSISSVKSLYYMIKVSLSILLHRAITPSGEGCRING